MRQSALILLDLQKGTLQRVKPDTEYLARITQCIQAAREAEIPIVHVKTAFRAGHPDVSSRNFSFGRIASLGGFVEGDSSTEFMTEASPQDEDVVVTKRRTGPFGSSDLEVVLRGLGVDSLVLGGVATSGAVLSTMRVAADLDFNLMVLKDLCLDPDEEVHRILVDKILPKQGRVLGANEWIGEIGKER